MFGSVIFIAELYLDKTHFGHGQKSQKSPQDDSV